VLHLLLIWLALFCLPFLIFDLRCQLNILEKHRVFYRVGDSVCGECGEKEKENEKPNPDIEKERCTVNIIYDSSN
jgi:hypothetical protein